MLGIQSDDGRYFIDLTFRPEDDPSGSYYVDFYRATGNLNRKGQPDYWERLGGGPFRSRPDVVESIERFMHDIWRYGEPNVVVGDQQ